MTSKNTYKKRVESGQDIYDLSLQEYGAVKAVFLVLEDNPSLDLEQPLIAGQELVFRVEPPEEVKVYDALMYHYRNKKLRVRTSDEEEPLIDDEFHQGILSNDGQVITTSKGEAILVSQTPAILTGVLSSTGDAITTSTGDLIIPSNNSEQLLTSSMGFAILDDKGESLIINFSQTILLTNDLAKLSTSNGDSIAI